MQTSTFGLYIVGAFLLINLLLGLWAGRDVKDIRDYAIGNKKWSTGALVMTYLATAFGGGFLFRESKIFFDQGLIIFFVYLGIPISEFIVAMFFSKNFNRYSGCVTLGDLTERIYGTKEKIFVGLLASIYSIVTTAIQIQALSMVFEDFLNIHSGIAIILSGLIITIYTTIGGIRSVTATDILQFLLLLTSIFILSNIAVAQTGGAFNLFRDLPADRFDLLNHKNYSLYISFFSLNILGTVFIQPQRILRFLMCKNSYQAKKVFLFSAVSSLVLISILAMLSYAAIVLFDGDNTNFIQRLYNELIPNRYKIIIILGFLGLIFSSGDSCLHAAGLSISNDFISPFLKNKPLKVSHFKLITFITGIGCTFIASKNLLHFPYAMLIMLPVVVPIILGLFGVKTYKKSFWISVLTFFTIGLLISLLSVNGTIKSYILIISLIGAFSSFFISNFYINQNSKNLNDPAAIHMSPQSCKKADSIVFRNPFKLFNNICATSVYLHGRYYALFGSFYCIVLLIPYFIWGQIGDIFEEKTLYLKSIGLALCALLITHSIWPQIFKKYLPAFWYITLTYCLPFLSALMLILTHGAIEYTINVAINIMFLLLLVDWASAIGIALIGTAAAVAYYKFFLQIDPTETILGFDTLYLLIYQIIFGSLIGLLFARKKHIKLQNTDTKADYLITLNYAILDTNQRAIRIVEDSNKSHFGVALNPQENINEIKNLLESKNYEDISKQLAALETYVVAEAANISPYLVLNVNQIEISTLTEKCEKFCKAFGCEDISINIFTKKQKIQCDPIAIIKVLTKLISDYCKQAQANDEEDDIYINISITDAVLSYYSAKNGNFIRIQDALNITISDSESIDKEFSKGLFEKTLTDPTKIPYTNFNDCEMIDIERTVDAHYGILKKSEDVDTFAWACVLPVKVYDIRPITLDMSAPTTQDLNYEWPAADELEKIFLEKIKTSIQNVDEKRLMHAIDVIKIYHRHQSRKSGEPYYMHPISVAMIVIDLINDKDATVYNLLQENQETVIITVLLHDILEDTYYKPKNLVQDFGSEVLQYVESVTKTNYEARQYLLLNREAFQTLLDKEPITIVVKLADRLHNIMTIDGHPSEQKRRAVAEETLDFFVAPAKKLGFTNMAQKLEGASNYILRNGKLEGFGFKMGK